ncbi:MAG: hypothetical protein CMO81_02500 [Waddliaceae bacterium]|nr:hypothetical protein [Waddliaceae bacterium]
MTNNVTNDELINKIGSVENFAELLKNAQTSVSWKGRKVSIKVENKDYHLSMNDLVKTLCVLRQKSKLNPEQIRLDMVKSIARLQNLDDKMNEDLEKTNPFTKSLVSIRRLANIRYKRQKEITSIMKDFNILPIVAPPTTIDQQLESLGRSIDEMIQSVEAISESPSINQENPHKEKYYDLALFSDKEDSELDVSQYVYRYIVKFYIEHNDDIEKITESITSKYIAFKSIDSKEDKFGIEILVKMYVRDFLASDTLGPSIKASAKPKGSG